VGEDIERVGGVNRFPMPGMGLGVYEISTWHVENFRVFAGKISEIYRQNIGGLSVVKANPEGEA
jgi:hypothetical protein